MEDIIFYNNEAYNTDLYESYPGSAQYHASQKTKYSCNQDDYALVFGDPVITSQDPTIDPEVAKYLNVSILLNGEEYNGEEVLFNPEDEIEFSGESRAVEPNFLQTIVFDEIEQAPETEFDFVFKMDKTHRLTFIFADQTRVSFLFVIL